MTNFTNHTNNSTIKHYFDTNNYLGVPDENGFFGNFGGSFVPDVIANDLKKIKKAFYDLRNDEKKLQQLYSLLIIKNTKQGKMYGNWSDNGRLK